MTINLGQLEQLANAGDFNAFLSQCRQQMERAQNNAETLVQIGSILLRFGYLSQANECFQQSAVLLPGSPAPWIGMANVLMEAGEHQKLRSLYAELLRRWPNQATLYRNALSSQAYDPESTDADRLEAARFWGQKALARTGGLLPRPRSKPVQGRPLRVGYVSADFCNHTAGLFLRKVLAAHDQSRVTAFAYAHLQQDDWVTQEIRRVTEFSNITALDHQALAEKIRADQIDVLVDLSGHTAGSRLLSFVYRPAPVMVSWLGYYATTGLPMMDAVLLDPWHAPDGAEQQFVESVVRLPWGRFCYSPQDFVPRVAPAPFKKRGRVTFGCFNNSAKLNDAVFDVWAEILRELPETQMILKWRTFQDPAMREKVWGAFAHRGVERSRIELRGASFHKEMLSEYGDIDIALDPFPFSGGITSCEALYLGVPVVTWPQSRVVSRQTLAFLSVIGMPELAAADAKDYIRIAVALAQDSGRLLKLRKTLRKKLTDSPLCDVAGFTKCLEDVFFDLQKVINRE